MFFFWNAEGCAFTCLRCLNHISKYKDTTDTESLSHKIVHLITKFAIPIIEHLVANPEFHDVVVSKLKKMNDALNKSYMGF